jgi:hypothetical protein
LYFYGGKTYKNTPILKKEGNIAALKKHKNKQFL